MYIPNSPAFLIKEIRAVGLKETGPKNRPFGMFYLMPIINIF